MYPLVCRLILPVSGACSGSASGLEWPLSPALALPDDMPKPSYQIVVITPLYFSRVWVSKLFYVPRFT